MRFSLVLATVGRVDEVEAFIKSLLKQTYSDYELIIVDQNTHDKVEQIYIKYKNYISIKYVKAEARGLSYARNVGLRYIEGEVVSFPDDDCEYDKTTLQKVYENYNNSNNEIITFKIIDKETGLNSCGNWPNKNKKITKLNVFNTAISITIFVKFRSKVDLVFDEKLGVGTKLSSGEETDFVLSLLSKGYTGEYNKDICVYHPQKPRDLSRGYNYALGTGAVYYKEIIKRKNYRMFVKYTLSLIKPCIGSLKFLIKNNIKLAKYDINVFKGRIDGFRYYKAWR